MWFPDPTSFDRDTFDPETHDPFAGYDQHREIHQRINAVHRENQLKDKSNQPLVVDWLDIDKMAEVMSRLAFASLGELDRNPIAQKLAAEMMDIHTSEWRKLENKPYATRFCPEFDESSPGTRPYALTYGQDYAIFPLENLEDWASVAALVITSGNVGCSAHITIFCDSGNAAHAFPVKRGEGVCVFTCCVACWEFLHDPNADDFNYTGPREHWMADDSNNPQC